MNKVWNVAIYARVSTDKKEQFESIPVQVESLKRWTKNLAKEDATAVYSIIDVYEDIGKSGVSFNREAFIKMKRDIESKKINMIVTRDLSRFSRNYILAGYYLEEYFKVKKVRFVSVLDNVDSEKQLENDVVPFKNILNEMYIKDCSKRVRAALLARMERGSSIASKALYGYKFKNTYNGNEKTIRLVPAGDDTTDTIRKIFSLYLGGWGSGRISNYLNEKGIKSPGYRIGRSTGKWHGSTIVSILKNPKYAGYMAQGRYRKVSYKTKEVFKVPEEEWIYGKKFNGIIGKDVFYRVNEIMDIRKKLNYRYKGEVAHPFSTVLRCGGCGGSMTYKKSYKGYKCSNSQKGGGVCTAHSIKEDILINIFSEEIKKMSKKKIDKDKLVATYDKLKLEHNYYKEKTNIDKKLQSLNNRLSFLYEDREKGIINSKNFEYMISSMEKEQKNIYERKSKIEHYIKANKNNKLLEIYLKKLGQLLEGRVITRDIVETLIHKIVISELTKGKEKNIYICYKFSN